MENIQEKQLKELRRRLELLDGVIADFERLQAVCAPATLDYRAGVGGRRYRHGPQDATRAGRRTAPAS